ncbi:hypothetical protein M406DRAFT_57135 [Cryphonectria parasitica EP155]|uniref:Uncharacterized protein n=1 Tax=Cryphonectria parasitica (strain ATCC 38755 / EP155) TaxID=660469 RepID=A0A9P4XU64_CRYP1|nr:uncharacterized protein M406DRAFT_57135 [Cryphonectria parasitica EP155]KAF3761038.1 hypothetical protein M406DRAFT_57135 [Cryphonectria parasitica EP155]
MWLSEEGVYTHCTIRPDDPVRIGGNGKMWCRHTLPRFMGVRDTRETSHRDLSRNFKSQSFRRKTPGEEECKMMSRPSYRRISR